MGPAEVRTVTFDLWHTLVRLSPAEEDRYLQLQEAALVQLLEHSPVAGSRTPRERVSCRSAARWALEQASRRGSVGAPVTSIAMEAGRRAGRHVLPSVWVGAVEGLVDRTPFAEVPGAGRQLRWLRESGIRTAVVSNLVGETGRSMRRVLERLQLAPHIQAWALSEELPWAKPAPEIFWKALRAVRSSAAHAVHIGDLASDIVGARAAGYREAVWFQGAREYGTRYAELGRTNEPIEPPASRVLSDWDELPALLAEL